MALDRPTLKNALKTVFDTAKDENWSTSQIADGMAKAIEAFVKSGAVRKITINLENGNQKQDGKVE